MGKNEFKWLYNPYRKSAVLNIPRIDLATHAMISFAERHECVRKHYSQRLVFNTASPECVTCAEIERKRPSKLLVSGVLGDQKKAMAGRQGFEPILLSKSLSFHDISKTPLYYSHLRLVSLVSLFLTSLNGTR